MDHEHNAGDEEDPVLKQEDFRVARPKGSGDARYRPPTLEALGSVWELTSGAGESGSDVGLQFSP